METITSLLTANYGTTGYCYAVLRALIKIYGVPFVRNKFSKYKINEFKKTSSVQDKIVTKSTKHTSTVRSAENNIEYSS